MRFANYNRKSSEDQGRQVLSIDSQVDWAEQTATERGIDIAAVYREEKSASTPYRRPIFDALVKDIRQGRFDGIICWKMNRLARNPEEAGVIIGMLQRAEIKQIITVDREYRPEDNAIISYVDFAQADQFSRDLSIDVRRGLEKKLALGWYPTRAPLGYLNTRIAKRQSNYILVDPERFDLVRRMWHLMLSGRYTPPQILDLANRDWHFRTRTTEKFPGKPLSRAGIYRIFNNRFYCGTFEFPRGSGKWFRGAHDAMITEDEFMRVQDLLGNVDRPRPLTRRFAFTGLIRCAHCGAAITAEDRVKRQKNGNVHRYVYYHCTKQVDRACPEKAVEVKVLKRQIEAVLARLTISQELTSWAIAALDRSMQLVTASEEQATANRQRRLTTVTNQLDLLLTKFTSPENADGRLISDSEYRRLKGTLSKEQFLLEARLKDRAKERHDGVHRAETMLSFANKASQRFDTAGIEVQRAILTGISRRLMLRNRALEIDLRHPFRIVSESRDILESSLADIRTSKDAHLTPFPDANVKRHSVPHAAPTQTKKHDTRTSNSSCSITSKAVTDLQVFTLRGLVDDLRTYFEQPENHFDLPDLSEATNGSIVTSAPG